MFHQIERIHSNVSRIWDAAHTAMYLVEGSEQAVLIDTGVGVGSLKQVVESLTDKPITVLLTHGHVDHAMGAGEFDRVYMNPADRNVFAGHSQFPARLGYVSGAAATGGDPELIKQVRPEDFKELGDPDRFLDLRDGARFALGGVSVEVISAPGHTPGTVVILIPELRILMLGDACNAFTFLFEEGCPSVTRYRETLLGLKEKTDGRYDRVLFSHGMGEGTADMIENVIAVCDDILAGRADNIPFRGFNGEACVIAKAMDFARFCRADGKEGNLVYNPDNLI